MKNWIFSIISCLLFTVANAQQKFNTQQLNKAKSYGPKIVEMLKIKEIHEQNTRDKEGKVFIKNGLRSSSYLNPEDWLSINDQHTPNRIDIVFSKYPIRNGEYKIHYPLLCNRLKKLFAIDPFLNDDSIEWNIILQTHCESDEQVDQLFHGVVIHYPVEEKKESTSLNTSSIKNDLNFTYSPIADKSDSVLIRKEMSDLELLEEIEKLEGHPEALLEEVFGKNQKEKTQIFIDYFEAKIIANDAITEDEIDQEYLDRHAVIVKNFIKRFGSTNEKSVGNVFDRNPQWQKALIIADWTGSMYQYGAQALEWHILNFEKSGLQYFTLFNDGDRRRKKEIGKTEGIYFEKANNMDRLVNLYNFVMLKGSGGDGPENDLEAVIKGMEHYPDHDEVILIADNNACVRDMELLELINKPVHIIICGYYSGFGINPQYIEIASKTGGTLHTIEMDIENIKVSLNGKGEITSILDYDVTVGFAPCFSDDVSVFIPSGSRNEYTSLDSAMANKKLVRFLNLSDKGYKSFPQKVFKFKNLQSINLSNNKIDKFPLRINKLYNLKTINVSGNQISTMNQNMMLMSYLRNIDLSYNKFTELNYFTFYYKYLEVLNVSNNSLSEIPKNIKSRNLRELYLNNNQIKELPRSLGRLKKLEKISIAHNQIEELPITFGGLNSLKAIDLSYNKLSELPETFYRIDKPKIIILTGNPLPDSVIQKVKETWPSAIVEF